MLLKAPLTYDQVKAHKVCLSIIKTISKLNIASCEIGILTYEDVINESETIGVWSKLIKAMIRYYVL
jgi:hypothetical protein